MSTQKSDPPQDRQRTVQATSPGRMIQSRFLNEYGWSHEVFARKLIETGQEGLPSPLLPYLQGLFTEEKGVTAPLAHALADVFSMSPEFWFNVQSNWAKTKP